MTFFQRSIRLQSFTVHNHTFQEQITVAGIMVLNAYNTDVIFQLDVSYSKSTVGENQLSALLRADNSRFRIN